MESMMGGEATQDNNLSQNGKFYRYMILFIMVLFPICSVVIELYTQHLSDWVVVGGKWFLFWGVGVRLFTAGIKQAVNPSFTAKKIFNIKDTSSHPVVRELGYANICLGLAALVSLFEGSGRIVAAIAGGLYFGMAGLMHVIRKRSGTDETIAMVSDLFIFMLMAIYVVALKMV